MEDREGKNKFWKGILIGALATALFGLIAVTAAAGIWIMGRMTANLLGAASLAENENEDGGGEGKESPGLFSGYQANAWWRRCGYFSILAISSATN